MLHGFLASFQVLGIDEHCEIYRKAFRRPSGFVFAQPAVVSCRYCPAPVLTVVQDSRRARIVQSTVYNSMTISSTVRDRPVPVLYGLMIVSLAALLPLPPLLQDQSYHQFADQRELFGIPNFWNVVSNLPFIAVGVAGLLRFRRDATTLVLFTGLFLTGFGSSYYHLNPNDATLFWDRLPMTLCFAAILAAVVEERVDAKAGAMLLRPLLAIGIFSLLLWRWTDDLRLYA
ncbi:MAG: ceramidase domain-containing protein, partial [Bradyrhizobium sp.]